MVEKTPAPGQYNVNPAPKAVKLNREIKNESAITVPPMRAFNKFYNVNCKLTKRNTSAKKIQPPKYMPKHLDWEGAGPCSYF